MVSTPSFATPSFFFQGPFCCTQDTPTKGPVRGVLLAKDRSTCAADPWAVQLASAPSESFLEGYVDAGWRSSQDLLAFWQRGTCWNDCRQRSPKGRAELQTRGLPRPISDEVAEASCDGVWYTVRLGQQSADGNFYVLYVEDNTFEDDVPPARIRRQASPAGRGQSRFLAGTQGHLKRANSPPCRMVVAALEGPVGTSPSGSSSSRSLQSFDIDISSEDDSAVNACDLVGVSVERPLKPDAYTY